MVASSFVEPAKTLVQTGGDTMRDTTSLRGCFGRFQQEKHDYEKMVQERIGSDRYASRHSQTINWALKTKEVSFQSHQTKGAIRVPLSSSSDDPVAA